jgi:antirestriction protein ArdC
MHNQPIIQHKEQRAWYNPVSDIVNMPKMKTFESSESYYVTLFHELVHSTGHISRLNRKDLLQMSELGSVAYSHEELVAEIGTCYLQSVANITTEFEQSVAYIQGWLQQLKNDRHFIFSASTQAQKAVDYILNVHPEVKEDEGEKEDAAVEMH